MNFIFERNDALGQVEATVPRAILSDCKRAVYVFDDPRLEEDREFGKVFPLTLAVITDGEPAPTQEQRRCIEWILAHADKITARAESFLCQLANSEMRAIIVDEDNALLCEKHALASTDGYRRMYSLVSVAVTEVQHQGRVPYILSLSSAYDDEHGLSLLFLENRLIASSGSTDFFNRGDRLIPHARYCRSSACNYDEIDLG